MLSALFKCFRNYHKHSSEERFCKPVHDMNQRRNENSLLKHHHNESRENAVIRWTVINNLIIIDFLSFTVHSVTKKAKGTNKDKCSLWKRQKFLQKEWITTNCSHLMLERMLNLLQTNLSYVTRRALEQWLWKFTVKDQGEILRLFLKEKSPWSGNVWWH